MPKTISGNKSRSFAQLIAVLMIVYAAVNLLIGINGAIPKPTGDKSSVDGRRIDVSYELGKNVAKPSSSLLSILVHTVVLSGAIVMATGRRGPLPLIASILILLPCSSFFCLGIPLGVCSLALLRNPKATGAFDDEMPIDTSTSPCPSCGRMNSIHTKVCPKCNHRIAESG